MAVHSNLNDAVVAGDAGKAHMARVRIANRSLLLATAAFLLTGAPVWAQGTPPAPQDVQTESAPVAEGDNDDEEAIVVTGTRTRSGFDAPTPTQVLGVEDLERRGVTDVAQILAEVPAFNSRFGGASNGVRTQSVGQTYADLRGLGSPRTLVLVNGRRFVPVVPTSSVGNPYQVDLNLIPSLMVERMDIVTGGASAQWGSDAVAGVVNVILLRQLDGLKSEIQYGISQYGDSANFRVGAVGGFSFADGRGHVVLSGDYNKNDGISDYFQRDWADDFWQFYSDPTATAANGRPRNVLRRDTQPGNMTAGGLIVATTGLSAANSAQLVGTQFDSPTTVSRFVRGEFNTGTTFAANQAGGQNADRSPRSLIPSVERKVFYGLATYDVSDSVEAYLEGSWGRSAGESVNQPIRDRVSVYTAANPTGSMVRIYADNPYIPAALRGFIPAPAGPSTATQPGQSFTLGRVAYENQQPVTKITDTAYTVSTGLQGKFGEGWTWDASYTYGNNQFFRETFNMRNRALYALATDAVVNPGNGQIVCRSTLTNAGNGCVPVNLFGEGTPGAREFAYYTGTAWAKLDYQQHAAQLNIQGEPFETWAGPVSIAAGLEYRNESANATVDAITPTNVWDLSVGGAFKGNFNVKEGYFEATVPLAKELPFAHSLTLNGAVRYADYSGFGGATTWKVGGTWEPLDGLLLRAAHSLDIRAPTIYETSAAPATSLNNVIYNNVTYPGVLIENAGNPNLRPEKSRTTTFGAALTPGFLPGFKFSADYFNIKINDVIDVIGQAEIARLCGLGVSEYCNLLNFDGTQLVKVINPYLNLSSLQTKGIDFVGSYTTRVGSDGELALRASATWVDAFTITVPGAPNEPARINEQAGQHDNSIGATPHLMGNVSMTYSQPVFSITGQMRYVSSGKFDNAYTEVSTNGQPADIDPALNNIGAYTQFNLSGTINVGDKDRFQFFWNINNLFDRDPPIIPSPTLLVQTNAQFYDVIGRYYRVGVRLRF